MRTFIHAINSIVPTFGTHDQRLLGDHRWPCPEPTEPPPSPTRAIAGHDPTLAEKPEHMAGFSASANW
jgi:hypothetical protein